MYAIPIQARTGETTKGNRYEIHMTCESDVTSDCEQDIRASVSIIHVSVPCEAEFDRYDVYMTCESDVTSGRGQEIGANVSVTHASVPCEAEFQAPEAEPQAPEAEQ